MKQSVMTAGKIYETVFKMRKEIDELNDALNAVKDTLGTNNAAYKLLDRQKIDRLNELRSFEKVEFAYPQPVSFIPDSGKLF